MFIRHVAICEVCLQSAKSPKLFLDMFDPIRLQICLIWFIINQDDYQPSNYSTDFQKSSVKLIYTTLLRDTALRNHCMIEDLGLNMDAFLSCAIFVTVLFVNIKIECETYNNSMFTR